MGGGGVREWTTTWNFVFILIHKVFSVLYFISLLVFASSEGTPSFWIKEAGSFYCESGRFFNMIFLGGLNLARDVTLGGNVLITVWEGVILFMYLFIFPPVCPP